MKKIKILIIDDENSRDMIRIFDRFIYDFEPFVARDKNEALNLLNSADFDLITLDGQLLNGDHGRDVLKEMTEAQISKTIIYSADAKFIAECKSKGIRYFEKGGGIISSVIDISPDGESIKFLI